MLTNPDRKKDRRKSMKEQLVRLARANNQLRAEIGRLRTLVRHLGGPHQPYFKPMPGIDDEADRR